MNILHRRFHLIRGGNPGPTHAEGLRSIKVPAWLYPVAIVIVLAGVMVVVQPAEVLGFARADASGAAQRPPESDAAVKSGATQDEPFDYFPDHYINQAKEPAEPIDTF